LNAREKENLDKDNKFENSGGWVRGLQDFFFFLWYWSLNLGLHAGVLPFEPYLQPLASGFKYGSQIGLSGKVAFEQS
jgi:hypothetical protein